MSYSRIYQILQELQRKKSSHNYYNITWRQGIILSTIVETYQPNKILEVGTGNGFSTLWMVYKKNPECLVISIEISSENFKDAKSNFSKAKVDNTITLLNDDVKDTLLKLNEHTFDLIFIDALQKEYQALIEKIFATLHLSNNPCFIIDNIISHSRKEELIQLFNEKRYTTTIIEEGSGFLVATY